MASVERGVSGISAEAACVDATHVLLPGWPGTVVALSADGNGLGRGRLVMRAVLRSSLRPGPTWCALVGCALALAGRQL